MPKTVSRTKEQQRRERTAALEEALSEWMVGKRVEVIVAELANLQIALLARRFPANLSPSDKALIQDNYPDATDSLIEERAMSDEGVQFTLGIAAMLSAICLDYSPHSHCRTVMDLDAAHEAYIDGTVAPALRALYTSAVKHGVSPFGVTALFVVLGTKYGLRSGVHWAALARPLIDSVSLGHDSGMIKSPEETEERAIQLLMLTLSCSRATAKRYVKQFNQTNDMGTSRI